MLKYYKKKKKCEWLCKHMKAIDPRSTDATCISGPEIYIDSVLFPSHHLFNRLIFVWLTKLVNF